MGERESLLTDGLALLVSVAPEARDSAEVVHDDAEGWGWDETTCTTGREVAVWLLSCVYASMVDETEPTANARVLTFAARAWFAETHRKIGEV